MCNQTGNSTTASSIATGKIDDRDVHVGLIIGCVVGGVLFLIMVVIVLVHVCFYYRRRNYQKSRSVRTAEDEISLEAREPFQPRRQQNEDYDERVPVIRQSEILSSNGTNSQRQQVITKATKLTRREIAQMSPVLGIDWDSLAGLMDIPYAQREAIRFDDKYPSNESKAEEILRQFNTSELFDRRILQRHFTELKRHDLKDIMLPMENENDNEEKPPAASPPDVSADTRLSPREMFRLSRRIINWDELAGLLGISNAERDEIRDNTNYYDNCQRAEKILAIFNNMEDFSRDRLADFFKDINHEDLIKPVTTGEWRSLRISPTEE